MQCVILQIHPVDLGSCVKKVVVDVVRTYNVTAVNQVSVQ